MDEAERKDIESVTREWATAFNNRDAARACVLYDEEAVLWGTFSRNLASTARDVRQYFEKACGSPIAITVVFEEQVIRSCEGAMLNSGSYTFSFVQDGTRQQIQARFSMSFRKRGDRWLIVDHHSSTKPAPAQ